MPQGRKVQGDYAGVSCACRTVQLDAVQATGTVHVLF